MKWICCLLLLLCPFVNNGQQQGKLRVGDTIPNILLTAVYNNNGVPVSIPGNNGKYTLLDFWSTWCGSCIESFDKMHQLQASFTKQLQVLMVNSFDSDSLPKVQRTFNGLKKRRGTDFLLPYVLQDSILKNRFPHLLLPHYVWINKNGRVDAITGAGSVTEENIQSWLSGYAIALPEKSDSLLYDTEQQPALAGNTVADSLVLYRSLFTKYQPGLGSVQGQRFLQEGLIDHFYQVNMTLVGLYQLANKDVFNVPYKQIVYDGGIRDLFFEQGTQTKIFYCYELNTRPVTNAMALRYLQTDLERCFKVAVCNEYREVKCYVLSTNQNIHKAITKGGPQDNDYDSLSLRKFIRNEPVEMLVNFIDSRLPLPLVDETGLIKHIDMEFPRDFYGYSPAQVQAFLQPHGFTLSTSTRRLKMAVLYPLDKKKKNTSQKK